MDFKKIFSTLLTVAPGIASLVPGGALAGAAITAIKGALNLHPEASDDDVAAAIAGATPEQQVRIREIDANFKLEAQKAWFADLNSARDMGKANRGDWTPRILAYLAAFSATGLGYALLFHKAQADSTLAGMVLGYVFSEAKSVYSYFFGASPETQKK